METLETLILGALWTQSRTEGVDAAIARHAVGLEFLRRSKRMGWRWVGVPMPDRRVWS